MSRARPSCVCGSTKQPPGCSTSVGHRGTGATNDSRTGRGTTMSGMNRRQLLQFIGLTIVGVACAPSAPPAAPTTAPAPPAAPTTAPAAPTAAAAAPTAAVAKPTAAPAAAPAAKPAGGATVTLKVAHVTTAQKVWDDAWAGIWGSFESKNPGIKLELENNPFNGYQEKMLTSLAGGSDFDIIYGWEPWLTTFAEKNVIRPLDDYLGKDTEIKLDNFYPAAVEKWKGKVYGLGWFISGYQSWFNADMLKKADVDPRALEKDGKWTWEALQDLARKMSTGQGADRIFGYMHTVNTQGMSTPLWSAGVDYWDADGKKSMVNTPEFIDVLQQQMDMTLKGQVDTATSGAGDAGGTGLYQQARRVAADRTALFAWRRGSPGPFEQGPGHHRARAERQRRQAGGSGSGQLLLHHQCGQESGPGVAAL